MALGDRIRQFCKEAGCSQAELGGKVGADSQRVSRYETGKITPSLDAIACIGGARHVSVDQHLLVDAIPRRPQHAAEYSLGERLASRGELSGDDLASLLHVFDALVAKESLKTLAGGIS